MLRYSKRRTRRVSESLSRQRGYARRHLSESYRRGSRRLNESFLRKAKIGKDSIPGGENWEIATLDVWANPTDDLEDPRRDWFIDKVIRHQGYICIDPDADTEDLIDCLYRYLKIPRENVGVIWVNDDKIEVDNLVTGEPLLELYREL